ncbi:MAG: hypothetical protein LH613_00990 [Chamaesiphon sp.]|nr:hypothetical protein [Chamaesiphon sp.]
MVNLIAASEIIFEKDTTHPEIFQRLERCAIANQKLAEIGSSQRPQLVQWCQKLPLMTVIMWQLMQLCLLAVVKAEALDAIY